MDFPLPELLSQLSSVRNRAAAAQSVSSQLQQLEMQLQSTRSVNGCVFNSFFCLSNSLNFLLLQLSYKCKHCCGCFLTSKRTSLHCFGTQNTRAQHKNILHTLLYAPSFPTRCHVHCDVHCLPFYRQQLERLPRRQGETAQPKPSSGSGYQSSVMLDYSGAVAGAAGGTTAGASSSGSSGQSQSLLARYKARFR